MCKFIRSMRAAALVLPILAFGGPIRADDGINLRRTVIVDVVEHTKDAVVYISTTKTVTVQDNPFGGDPFFAPYSKTYQQRIGSLGSGFIIHKDGYVVTNHHVIAGAREITIELGDGRKLPAQVVSSDPEADLAILKVSADQPLPALQLGDSSDLMIGEPVIAVGNPLGFSHSVSSGIVSALHRDLKGNDDKVMMHDVIQTDAAINPGNSGGPLLNAYGQVIGINTAIRSDAQNIGFAIQVNRLRDLIPELMSPENFTQTEFPIKLVETRKITEPATIEAQVEVAGTGERVISIGGVKPHDIIDAQAILLRYKAGQPVELVTDKGTKTIKGTAAGLPDVVVETRKRTGMTVGQMTPIEAGKMGIDQETGVLVIAVDKGSVADKAGLEKGDIITGTLVQMHNRLGQTFVVQYRVGGLDALAVLLKHVPENGKVILLIVRPGEPRMGRTILDFGDSSK